MQGLCRLKIEGGKPLEGQVRIQGAKNAVLPILAATLLTEEPCYIQNCPDLKDVRAAFAILEALGCRVTYDGDQVTVEAKHLCSHTISETLMRQMRSSVMFLGAILGRCQRACISYPGGCELGARPIDIHLLALRRLGVALKEEQGNIDCSLGGYCPQTLTLMFPSVGATENIMLLCAALPGETRIIHPAREPEIVDLQNFLNGMGAQIQGAGSDCIRIRGVRRLHGCQYRVIPDRIVAATYASAVVACGGEALLTDVEAEHLRLFLSVLRDMGARTEERKEGIFLAASGRPKAVASVKTLPYPGFPTDMQPILMAALLRGEGNTVFHETIFENRFQHAGEFARMGADIRVEGSRAIVCGVPALHGAKVRAFDLRGGAALMVAALSAEGETTLDGCEHILRGYACPVEDFRQLGGTITWME